MRSLRHKLLLSYAILVLGILLVAGWSVVSFAVLGRSVSRIMAENYRSVLDAQVMKETLERQDSAMLFHVAGHTDKARRQFEENRQRFAHHLADARENITEPGEAEVLLRLGERWNTYLARAGRFLTRRPDAALREAYFAGLEPAFLSVKEDAEALLQLNQAAMIRKQQEAESAARSATRAAVGLAAGALILGVLYSVNLSRRLMAPLLDLTQAARRIGEGDLQQRIEVRTGDEVQVLGDEFNRMAERLREYRRREATRLHVAEQQAEVAINSLYEPVIVTDAEGEILGLNRAAEALFGPQEERVHQPVTNLGFAPLSSLVREAVTKKKPVAPESDRGLISVPVDHSQRHYRLRTAPLLREMDEVAGTVTVLEDVTRQRELDHLKDEFISVASHELRTPLTSMSMAVQLLVEGSAGPLTPKQAGLVGMVAEDAERLERLTRDLLDLTRLEAGTAVPHRQPVSPEEIAALGTAALRAPAEQKGVRLDVAVPAGTPLVSANPEQLARVVANLVNNAVRHTPRGGSVCVAVAPEGGFARFTVSDTGSGIPPDYLPRIFERFVQVPGATTGGAGLGLAIARKIVEAHGGRMWAESEPGNGARFHFTVPLQAERSEVEGASGSDRR
jgi:two-component system, NtrC family, sensor histidine kinase KinB